MACVQICLQRVASGGYEQPETPWDDEDITKSRELQVIAIC